MKTVIQNKKIICCQPIQSLWLLIAALQLIGGCATVPPTGQAPPDGPAASLLAETEQALQTGNYSQAELYVERALRVEPRNGRLWHAMARIRFRQRDYGQTVQFCLKSNTLAGEDRFLEIDNWDLLAMAYMNMGNAAKAAEARQKAAELR